MKFSALLILFVLFLCPLGAKTAHGEIFVLSSGGHIEGLLLNPDQSPRTDYRIMTKQGGRITIDAKRVEKVIDTEDVKNPEANQIEEKPADEQKESPQADMTEQEKIMAQRGYRRYKGRWLSPQEINSIEREQERKAAVRGWYNRLRLWSGWLGGQKSEQAQKAIGEINDPAAVDALADAMLKDRRRPAQMLYIEALFRLNTPAATQVLAQHALEDADAEIRLSCLDFLKKRKDPAIIAYFVSRLRHKNNVMVNRAAVALGRMDDPTAVGPLIDALVTVHKKKVTSGGPGRTSASFDNSGGGLTMGSTTKIYKMNVRNRDVLDALISLTDGVNFDYDIEAWRYWLAAQKKRKSSDIRRD